ncbi:hypothetical protein Acr_01g0009830 [Actinidia rufa]|uniref:Uncharacterized protein n=1 Tax=Actinidia rufa TaxID=165716 RepID=A0A7J0E3U9_9ERIC|nr:hypothetical protein Acr_01g0009830 [Actinidia rufa]
MVLTKHASNDPRGDYPNPVEPEIAFNKRWFKSLDFERKWAPEFKERHIITGRDFEKSFLEKYTHLTLAPMDALSEDKREEERVDEDVNDMDVEENFEILLQIEGAYVDPNDKEQEQDVGHGEEHSHEGVNEKIHEEVHVEYVHVESPMHGAYPSKKGTLYQEGPPAWSLGYFNELKVSLGEIKQWQEEIIQTQVRHEEYIARLGDTHHELRQQVDRLGDFYEA